MAKLYLKLENEDGSFREFRKDKIKARWVKEGFKHAKKLVELEREGDFDAVIDERLEFVCALFGDADLTPDMILDGLESEYLTPTLDEIYNTTMGYTTGAEKEPGK